jgi:hypothetical protein
MDWLGCWHFKGDGLAWMTAFPGDPGLMFAFSKVINWPWGFHSKGNGLAWMMAFPVDRPVSMLAFQKVMTDWSGFCSSCRNFHSTICRLLSRFWEFNLDIFLGYPQDKLSWIIA